MLFREPPPAISALLHEGKFGPMGEGKLAEELDGQAGVGEFVEDVAQAWGSDQLHLVHQSDKFRIGTNPIEARLDVGPDQPG